MKEQLHATEKRSLGAKSIKLIKGALRNPLTYGAISLSMISWAGVDVATASNNIDRQLDEAFPLTATIDVVNEPQREVLVFDIASQQEQRNNLKERLELQAFVRQSNKGVGGMLALCASGFAAFALNRRQQINETRPKGTTNT